MKPEVNGSTILVLDNDEGIRRFAGKVLRSYGYTVLEAADGVEALEVAEKHPGPLIPVLTAGPLRACWARYGSGILTQRDEQFGVTVVRRACEEPVRQIVLNCGTEGAIVAAKIKSRRGDPNFGFNATTEQFEDLVKAGVIDPAKVTRTALQNAASIASLMLTTEAIICEMVEKPDEAER